jgi:hypothetical protein
MVPTRRFTSTVAAFVFGVAGLGAANSWASGSPNPAPAQQPAAPNSAVKQVVGTIKAINGKTITLTSDAGANVFATVTDSTRIVRVEPGQTDLKTAVPLTFEELQTGDRILIRGALSADGTSLTASGVIAMKHADLQAKQQQVLDDWQKRGIGGLVSSVDPAAGVINVSVVTAGGARTIVIHTSKSTILRRYAPDSVKFDDAKISAVADIRPGDQLRARGARSQDGADLTADEIVSGSFRNISGTVVSVDAASNTLTVTDLVTKKPVLVKVTTQSQIRKLSPAVAQGLAARLKGPSATQTPSGNAPAAAAGPGAGPRTPGGTVGAPGGAAGGGRGGGAADFQQVVSRMPPATLMDFQKSDAVMIVSTSSADNSGVTAITLVGGVEPILAASPNASQDMVLSPWNVGGGEGGGEAAP